MQRNKTVTHRKNKKSIKTDPNWAQMLTQLGFKPANINVQRIQGKWP